MNDLPERRCAHASKAHRSRMIGLAYVEALVATIVVAVAVVPAVDALRDGVAAAGTHLAHTAAQQRLQARMEQVLANRFGALDAAALAAGNDPAAASSLYSDPAGTAERVVVRLYRTDGNAATATDTGLLRIDVAIERSALALSTLRAR